MNSDKLSRQVSEFVRLYSDVWWGVKSEFPKFTHETDYWYKRKKEKETDIFIESFVNEIKKFPSEGMKQRAWKQNVQILIDKFINNSNLVSEKDKEILLKDDLIQVTEDFIAEVKKFNTDINAEDIGQAMRNVWIMNLIQMLLGKSPKLTPSVFGYSMLYPYTDNYLDDTEISAEEKNRISDLFAKRLAGESVIPGNKYEESLFKLVEKIEGEYKRSSYPEVFESLLCIHNAQRKSLKQQGKLSSPYETDILGISIEKGGISVLADAYLVNGTLTEKQAAFFFGYGVLLQICDDLQDGTADYKDQHMTIISQLNRRWYLDNITNKLINFTYYIVDEMDVFNCENINELKTLICKNCINLILFAAAKNKIMYSRKYFKQIKKYFPYRTNYMTNLYKKLQKKYANIKESYNGVPTDQIIMYALKKNAVIK